MTEPLHVVIMGVSGSGKTTVAAVLQDRLGWEFAEADEFHPQANIEKMRSGMALTDEDRWPWLELIRQWMTEHEREGRSTIVTCSALKRSYRDILRQGKAQVIFMHLDGDRALLSSRLAARTGHFMPATLLESQYATLEQLDSDELGAVVDIAGTPAQIATEIEQKISALIKVDNVAQSPESKAAPAEVGLYGLGVMGSALARNLAHKGYSTAVMNIDPDYTDRFMQAHGGEGNFVPAHTVAEFVSSLERPRKVLIMVTAGQAVDSVINQLSEYLESGDIVVDMGNSNFRDTRRREVDLRQRGLHFIGCGTSGGEEGALNGPALMIGATADAYNPMADIFSAIAAKAPDGSSCAVHVGTDGAGHLTKTLHNGIEYADMQTISEVYGVFRHVMKMSNQEISEVLATWNASELGSYLIEISSAILKYKDGKDDFIEKISDRASHKGTGAWSSMLAIELGVEAGMLVNSLFARFSSSSGLGESWHQRFSSPIEGKEHTDSINTEDLRRALQLCKIVAYTQGFKVIKAASDTYEWNIDLASVCRGWRAGCIIRGVQLDEFARLLQTEKGPDTLILSNSELIENYLPSLRKVVVAANLAEIPLAAMNSALSYLDSMRALRLPTALIQAQRDYFGAHGFERVDMEGKGFHGPWHDPQSK